MKIVRKIEFTGKNLNDVFQLPCVTNIIKIENEPWLVLNVKMMLYYHIATIGDTLVEYDNGMWDIQK